MHWNSSVRLSQPPGSSRRAWLFLVGLLLSWPLAGATAIPDPRLSALQADVRQVLQAARSELLQQTETEADSRGLSHGLGHLGNLYQAHFLREAAADCYRLAEKLSPKDYRWPYYLGYVLAVDGELTEARDAYTQALSLNPENPLILLRLGMLESELARFDIAEPLLRQAAGNPDLRTAALYELGKLALSRQDYDAAGSALEEALRLQPAATQLHYPLALVYRARGDRELARRHLAARGDGEPRMPDPLIDPLQALSTGQRMSFYLGMGAAHQRDFTAAARWFRQGVAAAPDNHAARISFARFLFLADKPQDARAELLKVPDGDENAPLAALLLAVLRQQAGDLQGAVARYRAGLQQAPDHPGLNYYLANALYRSGDYPGALDHYRRALQSAAGNIGADFWGILAAIRAEKSDAELLPLMQAAHGRHPENPAIGYFLAALRAASHDDAIRDGEQAMRIAGELYRDRPSPEHAQLLAMANAEVGDYTAARELVQQALKQARTWGRWELLRPLEQALALYESEQPSRTPWDESVLTWTQPPFDAAKVFESYPTVQPY